MNTLTPELHTGPLSPSLLRSMAPDHPPPLRAALLDIDGTLLDSNDAHARAWVDAFAEAGRAVPFGAIRPLIGKGGDKLMREVSDLDPDGEAGARVGDRCSEIFLRRYLATCTPFPQARVLLERMQTAGLDLVVVTAAEGEELDGLLEAAGVRDLIDEATSSSDVERSKPDPDIVRAALKKGGYAAGEALMLGDTPYDVEAARGAGVEIVAVRCGGWDDDALGSAVAVYDDPADLLANYHASPFAQRNAG